MHKTTFEDLQVFQAAIRLMVDVYRITESFPKREIYGLAAQMQRASVSVVSHIGEGQGRLTFGEWRQLLSQGRGSLYEVEAQTIASRELGYIDEQSYEHLRSRARDVGRLLAGLIKYVQRREAQQKKKPRGDRQQATGN